MQHHKVEAPTPETAHDRPQDQARRSGLTPTVPTRLRWALVLCLVWHGGLLLMGSFETTYDAWIHIFLGDHYRRDWFSTWDQRWYTGFTTISYPPGSHMAIAAVAHVTGSLRSGFVAVQLVALANLTIGVYRLSRMWVDERAASNAALLLVLSSAVAETVHVFGQLPTTLSLGFLLNAVPFVNRWVFRGRTTDLVAGVAAMAATTAAHHVTTLFGSIFFLGPILVYGLIECSRVPLPGEADLGHPRLTPGRLVPLTARRLRRITAPIARIAMLGPLLIGILLVVVLPYWFWSATDPIVQIPIPHGSRADFLEDRNLGLVFFVIPWGLLLIALPYALVRATVDRKWPLAASIALLAVLGTGGTTPIPKLLLGPAFDVLTLDRFTLWATVMVLPLAGQLADSLERGAAASWLRRTSGRRFLTAVQGGLVMSIVVVALFSATLSRYRAFQPDPIDPGPIVDFLEKDQHEQWRFLTLGFGDQMAWLSAQTTATQVDGNYHSVRRLPELTSTSVERLEGAKYRGIDGLGSLQQFLEVPEKYHLKFVFSNDQFYDPLLFFSGWQRLDRLENGVVVWERADIPPLPAQLPIREIPGYQRLMWGTIPPTMLVIGMVLIPWAALSRSGSTSRLDPARPDRRTVGGPLRVVDRTLDRLVTRLPAGGDPPRETARPTTARRAVAGWATAISRAGRSTPLRPASRILVLLALCSPATVWLAARSEPDEPAVVVDAYYDHLDFRRWREAYELLDPVTRPDYDLWRLRISADGGLLTSYGKLDRIESTVLPVPSDADTSRTTTVRAELRYLTATDWYPVTEELELIERGGRWRIVQPDPDITIPPEQLVRRSEVDYLIQGRRRAVSAVTELTDVLDRPELWISEATLMLDDGRPVIVGEVVNLDVDPADLTVTGVLKDPDGEVVLRYNATREVNHRLLPRESTPFRIDFEEVAAGTDLSFDPLEFSPARFDAATMVTAEVYAKAVVTGHGLYRGVSVNRAELVVEGGASSTDGAGAAGEQVVRLVGDLRNDGVEEATIPLVVIAFLDADGQVLWVENHVVEAAIRSQRTRPFSIELPIDRLRGLEPAAIDVARYQNGIVSADDPFEAPPALLTDVPDGLPFASIRVDVVTFVGASL